MNLFNASLIIEIKIDFGKPFQEVNFFFHLSLLTVNLHYKYVWLLQEEYKSNQFNNSME